MKAINSRDSFLISGLIHIMIAVVVILILTPDYKVVKEIDISFLFNPTEVEAQNQEIKSKTNQPPQKSTNKHITTVSPSVSQSAVTKTLHPSDFSEITSSVPIETNVSTNTVIVSNTNNHLPEKKAYSVSASASEKSFDAGLKTASKLETDFIPKSEGIDISEILESLTGRIESLKRYPYIARKKGIEGTVLLKIVLSESGELIHVFIKGSSGYEILDKDAVSLVRRACSNYKIKTGKAIQIELPVKYNLVSS